MRTDNGTNHRIDLADIWTFERDAFLKDETSKAHAKELLLKIQDEIFKYGEPAFGEFDGVEDNNNFHKFFDRNLKTYTAASINLKELFQLDFFFNKNRCYQYDSPIMIDSNHPDFDYWFALKLKHYQVNLKQLDEFLNFHLKNNFGNEKSKFQNFLKIVIRQYSTLHFSEILVESLNEWTSIKHFNSKVNRKELVKNSNDSIHSFLLLSYKDDSKYFEKNVNELMKVFKALKNHDFIDENTNYENFKSIFKNEKITTEKRIKWIGTYKELQWFIKALMYETKKIDYCKNDIWLVTRKCFVDKNGNDFEIGQLSNASGKNIARKELLKEIIDGIPN